MVGLVCVRPGVTFTSRRNCGRALAAAQTLAPASAWRNMTRVKPSKHLQARSLGEKLDSLRRGTRGRRNFFSFAFTLKRASSLGGYERLLLDGPS